MPWPFGLFGRSRQSPAGGPPPAVQRPSGREWASLPPIARAAGDLAPTAPARAFAAGLPGAVGLPLALRPLGHARTDAAPAGLVRGLAVPVQRYAGREPLPLAAERPARRPWPSWIAAAEEPQPAVVAPAVVEPEVAAADLLEPAVVAPDIVAPDIVAPDIVAPDIVAPDVVQATGP
ncbi:MAG TPA: hypothetical protein VGO86_16670, partial [Candidatus Dormibacteraeota bacterium]